MPDPISMATNKMAAIQKSPSKKLQHLKSNGYFIIILSHLVNSRTPLRNFKHYQYFYFYEYSKLQYSKCNICQHICIH